MIDKVREGIKIAFRFNASYHLKNETKYLFTRIKVNKHLSKF
jgi:hypothetical protein